MQNKLNYHFKFLIFLVGRSLQRQIEDWCYFWYHQQWQKLVLFLIPSALLTSNKKCFWRPLVVTCGYLWILISDKNCFWRPLVVRNDDRDHSWFRCQLCFFPLPPFLNITSSCVLLFTPLNKLLIEQHKTLLLVTKKAFGSHSPLD